MSPSTEATKLARTDPAAEMIFYGIMTGTGENVYDSYHQLRAAAPALITQDKTLVLSRHADCDAALRNNSLGKGQEYLRLKAASVSEERLNQVMSRLQRSMILTNPPDHTRLRRLVSAGFTGGHVEALRGDITRRADQLLNDLAAKPGGDFMSIFALPFPCHVISDLLGVPEPDREGLMPYILDLALLVEPTADADQMARGVTADAELAAYFADLLATKRKSPADDLLSRLAVSQAEDSLDETEVLATVLLLFLAGNKTTADLLGNGLVALFNHPEELARLRGDRGLVHSAVEELLRYDAPLQLNARSVLEPVTIAGADLEPGQTVIILLGAANRDPERFPDPDRFDVTRGDSGHLSFASGIHFCLGAQLARLELEVALSRLLYTYSSITPAGEAVRHQGMGMRAYEQIPVTLTR